MSIFTPSGVVHLLANVPLNNSYEHTVDFGTDGAQAYYFDQKTVFTLENESYYSYIRKDSTLKVYINIENLYAVNYVMYKNGTFGKRIYAFVTDKKYISDTVSELTLETDVLQTFMFDYTVNASFIEREHQQRWERVGVPIYSLTEEGLTLGDEYMNEYEHQLAVESQYYLVITTEALESKTVYVEPNTVQTIPTPYYYYVVSASQSEIPLLSTEASVVSISLLPFLPFDWNDLTEVHYVHELTGKEFHIMRMTHNMVCKKIVGSVTKLFGYQYPTKFERGVVRAPYYESKLLCYPYNYVMLTQYQGAPLILKNEYLNDQYRIEVSLVQNIDHALKSKYYVSSGYKNDYGGKESSLINNSVNDLPLLTDVYKNYIQQHKTSLQQSMVMTAIGGVGGVVGAIAGAVTGNPVAIAGGAGLVGNALGNITGELSRQKDLQNTPDNVRQMGNNISFDVIDGNTGVKLVRKSVHYKVKELLSDFWSMYGYKCQRVKKPDLRSRYYYNFIKTIGANVTGNMEQTDINKIKSVYDAGVTIWHVDREGVNVLDYTYDNVEMNLYSNY